MNEDRSTKSIVYSKPTKMEQLFQFHFQQSSTSLKISTVVRTLLHRAEHLVSEENTKKRKYGISRMLYLRMATNAGCSRSLLDTIRTAAQDPLEQLP